MGKEKKDEKKKTARKAESMEAKMSAMLGRRCLGVVGQSELLDRVGQIRNRNGMTLQLSDAQALPSDSCLVKMVKAINVHWGSAHAASSGATHSTAQHRRWLGFTHSDYEEKIESKEASPEKGKCKWNAKWGASASRGQRHVQVRSGRAS